MEPTEIANARAAYNAYNAGGDPATANKNFRGEPCPEWDDLPQNVRDKWIAAMKPSAETLDCACRWRDDVLNEWRKNYPCPRGCGTIGQCVDPATMSPAICPVCYNEAPAVAVPKTIRIGDAVPGDVLRDDGGDVWVVLSCGMAHCAVARAGSIGGFTDSTDDAESYGPFVRLVPEPTHAK